MRTALLLVALLACAAPAAGAPPSPEKPGAGLAAIALPPCDYRTDYWTPVGSLSTPLAAGDYAAVEAELEELHASFERNHACENRMKRAFLSGFSWENLPALLDRWVAARPDAWTAYAIRGLMWQEKLWQARWGPGDRRAADMQTATERAVADLERAIELHPSAMVAHAGLLKVHQIRGDRARLEEAFARAIAIDPVSVHLLETMLVALDPRWGDDLARTEAIVAEARRHEQRNPRVARVYGYPAAWHARKLEWTRREKTGQDHVRIIAAYSRALRYAEPSTDWHYRRAWSYSRLGNQAATAADVAFALAMPEPAESWFSLGAYALNELGRHDEALATAREGLRRFPGSLELAYYEADVFLDTARYTEAEQLFRSALARAPAPEQRLKHLRGLGEALLEQERWAEAEPVLLQALAIDESYGFTWHQLAEARWNLGRRAAAVPAYERFIALTAGQGWADERAMRAQERIELVRSGAPPPPAGPQP